MSSPGPTNFNQPILSDPINPYAPTATEGSLAPELTDAETLRKSLLSHEASIQGIGTLYLLGAIFMVPLGILAILTAFAGQNASDAILVAGLGSVYLGLGLLQGYAGMGLRRLTNSGRILGIGFGAIGLLGFPIGTLISIYILYLLLSRKGVTVFSDRYRQAIAQTPHIKYRTSIVIWILLSIVLALMAFGLLAAFFAG